MRFALVLGLCLVGLALVAVVERPISKPVAAVVARTIPQDAAKLVKRRDDRLDWYRRTLVGAYDKSGRKNPRWDDKVRVALDLAARMSAQEIDPRITPGQVQKAVRVALDAGSDDPLLRSIAARTVIVEDPSALASPYRDAAKALAASDYPAFRKAIAYQYAGSYAMSDRDEAAADFDAALDLLGQSAATDERNEFWEDAWIETLKVLIAGYRRLGMDAPSAYVSRHRIAVAGGSLFDLAVTGPPTAVSGAEGAEMFFRLAPVPGLTGTVAGSRRLDPDRKADDELDIGRSRCLW
jgi:hypothetical protein